MADILTKQKCLLSSPLPNISFLSKSLNLVGCYASRKATLRRKYRKTGNFCVVEFSWNFAVSISPQKLKSAKYFPIFEKISVEELVAYMVAVVTYSPAVRPVICNYLKTICHYKPFD